MVRGLDGPGGVSREETPVAEGGQERRPEVCWGKPVILGARRWETPP